MDLLFKFKEKSWVHIVIDTVLFEGIGLKAKNRARDANGGTLVKSMKSQW
jgi:hypothetical protein